MIIEAGGAVVALCVLLFFVYANSIFSKLKELSVIKTDLNKRVDMLYIKHNGNLTEILEVEREYLTKYEYQTLIQKTLSIFDEEVNQKLLS